MADEGLEEQIAGIAALADPVRRALFLHVAAQDDAVGREQAADATGTARHTAKFHLDKLVDEGLLVTECRRLSGRQGPGAGRPAKLYRRSPRQLSVSLPERRYDLAGALMARAIETSARPGVAVVEALHAAAAATGAVLGDRIWAAAGRSRGQLLRSACSALSGSGYEPRLDGARITLANCPFDEPVREHTDLVCGMNLALLSEAADRTGRLEARLEPGPDRCYVVLTGR